jgi:hypothetical protein
MSSLPATRPPAKPLEPVAVTGRILTGLGQGLHDLFHGCAILEIEGDGKLDSYWVTLNVSPDGHIAGVRVQRFATGQRYDLPADLSSCDCPDQLYRSERPGGCKHMVALRQALVNVAKDNPPPKRVNPRVERDAASAPPADFDGELDLESEIDWRAAGL